MLEGLDSVDWHSLTHAYGPADDIPDLLRDIMRDPLTPHDLDAGQKRALADLVAADWLWDAGIAGQQEWESRGLPSTREELNALVSG